MDGQVEIMAEGERVHIEELITLVRQGPPAARVNETAVRWLDWTGEFSDFRITW
jgi:acylphosphatase